MQEQASELSKEPTGAIRHLWAGEHSDYTYQWRETEGSPLGILSWNGTTKAAQVFRAKSHRDSFHVLLQQHSSHVAFFLRRDTGGVRQ